MVFGVAAEDLEHCCWKSIEKGIVNGNFKGATGFGARGTEPPSERAEEFGNFLREVQEEGGWAERARVVELDGRCESLPSGLSRCDIFCWDGLVSAKGVRRGE